MKNILFLSTFLSILVGCNVETLTAEVPKEAAPQAEVLPMVEKEEVEPAPIEEPVVPKPQPSKLGKIVGYSALGVLGTLVLALAGSKAAYMAGDKDKQEAMDSFLEKLGTDGNRKPRWHGPVWVGINKFWQFGRTENNSGVGRTGGGGLRRR